MKIDLFSKPYDPLNYVRSDHKTSLIYVTRKIHLKYDQILRKIIERKFTTSNFLFIISTMRSGSTLLNHLLLQNNDIISIGETHTIYNTNNDLKMLMLRTYYYYRISMLKNYIFLEKCNHNYTIQTPSFIEDDRIKIIIMLRNPIETISSLLNTTFPHSENINSAINYYNDRLIHIQELSNLIHKRKGCFFLTYDDLTKNSEDVLNSLSHFLGIKKPLTAQYKLHRWTTDLGGRGDRISKNILKGEIIRNKQTRNLNIDKITKSHIEDQFDTVVKKQKKTFYSI